MPKPPIKTGHVAVLDMDVNTVKQTLARGASPRHRRPSLTRPVRGSLVPLPKDFLTEVNMVELSAAVNSVTSVSESSRRPC